LPHVAHEAVRADEYVWSVEEVTPPDVAFDEQINLTALGSPLDDAAPACV
jgi:hypothetical protein